VRRPRLPAWPVDIAIVGILFATGAIEAATMDDLRGPLAANLLALAAVTAPLAWRRRHPLAALGAIIAAASVQAAALTDATVFGSTFLVLLLGAYSVGAYAADRRALLGLLGLLALVCVVNVLSVESMAVGDYVWPAAVALFCWLAGRATRHRARLAEELHEAAVRAEEDREAHRRAAVAAERRRVAREMHDIVAHSISVMVVQAGGGRRILDRDPQRAAEAAARIEQAGREALAEMRRLLGVLHPEERAPEREPQPGMAGLEALVERARGAGLPVALHVEGERPELSQGLDLAAYRIVQEALTNALRHAGGAPAEVLVRYGPDAIELEVADRGRGPAAPPGAAAGGAGPAGHGLVGMRERAQLYGGELHAGPRPGGGFTVRARLPVGDPALMAV
jgi:signal transduction histidine kinase